MAKIKQSVIQASRGDMGIMLLGSIYGWKSGMSKLGNTSGIWHPSRAKGSENVRTIGGDDHWEPSRGRVPRPCIRGAGFWYPL